jgi:ribosomal protein S12 methylthiotransferase accessory factor
MMKEVSNSVAKSKRLISSRLGLMQNLVKLPRLNTDPRLISFGIWASDTLQLQGEKFAGRSSGCNSNLLDAYMGTIGETVERYCPAFYDTDKMIKSSYKNLNVPAVPPSEYALFHEEQYKEYRMKNYRVFPLDEDIELYWDNCFDLTTGKETYAPGACIYLPWTKEEKWVNLGTSTGLAAHTNYYKALLIALYEIIERDSFVITWHQKIPAPKIIIDKEIQAFLDKNFPIQYEWHLFDITYDLKVPTAFAICFGEAEYGKFVAVGTATRSTIAEALQKAIMEVGQVVSYFRYLLGEKKDWMPDDDFNKIANFEDHSIFYLKRPEHQHIFDLWRQARPTKQINFQETSDIPAKEMVLEIVRLLKNKNYNVLVKDITTPDVNQAGFYSLRVIVPQLLQMGGSYQFYFLGGKRLYDVPKIMGYNSLPYEELHKFPHPFP